MDAAQEANQPTTFGLTETMRLLGTTTELSALALKSRDEISRLWQTLQMREAQVEELNQNLEELKVKGTEWEQERKEHLLKRGTLENELKETRTRLSRLFADTMRTNNAEICDLSDEYRPTKIAERYAELYDNQWTDAFEILDKSIEDEKTIIEILRDIFIDCWRSCMDLSQAQINELRRALMSEMESDTGEGTEIPADTLQHFQKNRKRCAANTIEAEFELYRIRKLSLVDGNTRHVQQVFPFVKECFRLAYYMAIQDCPIQVDLQSGPDDTYDQSRFREYTQRGETVDFIVWPCIFLHKEGPVLSKGTAQCRNSSSDVTVDLEAESVDTEAPETKRLGQLKTKTENDLDIAETQFSQEATQTCDIDDIRIVEPMKKDGRDTDVSNAAKKDVTHFESPDIGNQKVDQSHTATSVEGAARRGNEIPGRKSTNQHPTSSNYANEYQGISLFNDFTASNVGLHAGALHTRGPEGSKKENKQSSPTRKGKNKNKNKNPKASNKSDKDKKK